MERVRFIATPALALAAFAIIGCNANRDEPQAGANTTSEVSQPRGATGSNDVAAQRSKLSPEERSLVEAQEWCVIMDDVQLGEMGPPIKFDIKGQTVFVCCQGCKKKAERNPDKTLAKVEEVKAKVKAEKAGTAPARK